MDSFIAALHTPTAKPGSRNFVPDGQRFFHTPEAGNKDVLTSFPYAFRSTRGGLDAYVGWDSERKKRKKRDEAASVCDIL